jgi:hypothetical protein
MYSFWIYTFKCRDTYGEQDLKVKRFKELFLMMYLRLLRDGMGMA